MSPRFSIRPLSAQADARLAELARAGDERAFEVLVRRHRRALSAYCRGIGLPEHRVEDVLQQSLTKAWLALARGAEVREPRAWLYRIVHNTAINTIRAERRDACESIEAVPMAEMPHAGGEIDLGLHARDALGHVAALPEQQRQAITLTALQGHSHEHTAGLLGVSDTAVRGLIYRARTTLRRAAAAFSPQGLLGLLARTSSESGAAERTAELSAAGGAAAGAGILGKGLLAGAVAGLLAAGGTVVGLQGHAMRSLAHHHAAARAAAGRSDAPVPIASAGAGADRLLSPSIDAQGGRPVGRRDASGLHEGLRRGDGSRHRDDSARGEGLLSGRDGGRGDGRPRSSQRDGNSGGGDSSTRSAPGDASGSSGTSDGGQLSGATFDAARTTTDDHSGGSGTSGGSASSDSSGGSTAIQSGSTSGNGGSGSSGGGGTGGGSGSGDAEALAASGLG
jgi:RNA polymerase sigma factor (sigma-70 family)